MLGPPKARHVDRPVTAALEDLVPPGHFYRHLEAGYRIAAEAVDSGAAAERLEALVAFSQQEAVST